MPGVASITLQVSLAFIPFMKADIAIKRKTALSNTKGNLFFICYLFKY